MLSAQALPCYIIPRIKPFPCRFVWTRLLLITDQTLELGDKPVSNFMFLSSWNHSILFSEKSTSLIRERALRFEVIEKLMMLYDFSTLTALWSILSRFEQFAPKTYPRNEKDRMRDMQKTMWHWLFHVALSWVSYRHYLRTISGFHIQLIYTGKRTNRRMHEACLLG